MSLLPIFNAASRSAARTASTSRVYCSFLPSLISPAYPPSSLLSAACSLPSSFLRPSLRFLSSFASPRPASSRDSHETDSDFEQPPPRPNRSSRPSTRSASSFTPSSAADGDGVYIPARRSPIRARASKPDSNRRDFAAAPSSPASSSVAPSLPTASSELSGAAGVFLSSSSPFSVPSPGSAPSLSPDDYPMDPRLRDSLRRNFRISSFFPIQAQAYQPIVDGRDVLARSKTGTGKTLAFILPLLEKLKRERIVARKGEISVLVMEPTRELANQVTQEIEKLSPDTRVCAVYGGVGYGPQTDRLLRGVDVCVGTPGRLMDLLDKGACTLREVRVVVLDEADEMLRRGFKEDMEKIMGYANRQRKVQMLLFSATLPEWILQVSSQFQSQPLLIDQVSGDDNSTPLQMEHVALPAPRLLVDRLKLIGELARSVRGRVILFVNSKVDADVICSSDFEDELGVDARALHGDVPQARRDKLMQAFKAGQFKMLVATDIAARGLDIPDVQLVLQNGLPSNKEFYVHRAGRTARAGKAGRCVVLYKEKERQDVGALGRELRVQFSFQAPPPVNGEYYSAIDGEPGYMTFISQAAPNSSAPTRDDVVAAMEEIAKAPVQPGSVERSREAILVDVPAAQAKQIAESLSSRTGGLSLAVVTELPSWLVGERKQYQGFGRGGGSQRTGGSRAREGGGGGRGREGREVGGDQRGAAFARGDRQGTDRRGSSRPAYDGARNSGRSGGNRGRSNADTSYRAGSRFGSSRSEPWA